MTRKKTTRENDTRPHLIALRLSETEFGFLRDVAGKANKTRSWVLRQALLGLRANLRRAAAKRVQRNANV